MMSVVADSADAAQAEGDGTDGSDSKPPNRASKPSSTLSPPTAGNKNGARLNGKSPAASPSRAPTDRSTSQSTIPLPPPDTRAFAKQPGTTRGDLAMLVRTPSGKSDAAKSTAGSASSHSPTPTISDSEWSLAPPAKSASRANSTSSERPAIMKVFSGRSSKKASAPTSPEIAGAAPAPRRASSVKSDDGGQKFTLKDLLANGPKLSRRSSQRSTGGSSRKSDSDGKSVGGDSTASLLKKYGVCEKVAIGKGATSVVRLAHKWDRSEEKLYAVKEFRKRRKNETEKEYVKKLTAEFCISSTLHHINIVETVDLVQDEAQHWCEVMEFCPGGDLYAAIKKGGMSPSEVECCFKQILTGVSYLHGQGVAHRDIKPENLFFDMKGHLKIGDYGASTVYRLPWEKTIHMSTGLCGSEPYIAPEQFLGKPYDARLVDIWACGIVYYCLHFQELPWRVAQATDPLYVAYAGACASPQADKAACPQTIGLLSPRQCRPLIRKMLEPDPKQRYTIEDVVKHAWVESVEVCYTAPKPTHIHVHAHALAKAQVQVAGPGA